MNLIQEIRLPGGQTTSNLGLGCAGILRLPTRSGRETLLRTAVEEGVTHFDVARMYGDGEAEAILGTALKSIREPVTIATKFGLPYSAGGASGMKSMAKWLVNKSGLKSTLRKVAASRAPATSDAPPAPNHYSVEEMEKSLALSLEKLQRDRVDLFFLHAPTPHDNVDANLGNALREKKASGKIGAFGLSGYRAEMEHFLQKRPDICGDAIQYFYPMLDPGSAGQPLAYGFTGMFSVIDSTLGPLSDYLARDKKFSQDWSGKLGIDLAKRENVGIVILAIALNLNPTGLVLFFTSNPKRLSTMVRRLRENSFTGESLTAFREAVVRGIHAD